MKSRRQRRKWNEKGYAAVAPLAKFDDTMILVRKWVKCLQKVFDDVHGSPARTNHEFQNTHQTDKANRWLA